MADEYTGEPTDMLVTGFVYGILRSTGLPVEPILDENGEPTGTIRVGLPPNAMFTQTYVDIEVHVPLGYVDVEGAEAIARAVGWKPGDPIA